MQQCNFCEKESCFRIVKMRAGFFLETFLCEYHKKELKNKFNILMKDFMDRLRANSPDKPINENFIIGKLNSSDCHCKTCNTTAEMILSTGFLVCKDCISVFDEVYSIFSIDKTKKIPKKKAVVKPVVVEEKIEEEEPVVEVETPVVIEKKELTKEDIIKDNVEKIIKMQERLAKYVKKEDFTKCIEIRDQIAIVEQENKDLAEKLNQEADKTA